MNNKNIPLYMQIIEYLKEKIYSNELKSGDPLPTEAELAEMFDVSRITSNRAFVELEREGLIYRIRGSGSFVADQKKENNNIEISGKKILGLVLPFDSSRGRLIDTIEGAVEYLSKYGYYLSVHNAKGDHNKERNIIEKLVDENFLGIIYYPDFNNKNLDLINRLYVEKFPIVTIDKYYDSIPISYVISDNFKGGYIAAEHLIDLGHSNIAFVSGVKLNKKMSIRDRYFGFYKAINEKDIEINDKIHRYFFKKEFSEFNGESFTNSKDFKNKIKKFINKLISLGVTGIILENDYLAISIQKICDVMGIYPANLSIVGFDNLFISSKVNIPLTTVEQKYRQIGKNAAEILVKSIEQKKYNYKQVTTPVELISRESTAVCE